MELYEIIKSCKTEEELRSIIKRFINYYSQISFNNNGYSEVLGALAKVSPCEDALNTDDKVYSVTSWLGYIPKNMKIVYGAFYDRSLRCYTKGCYYYLDDDSYVYDFANYLKKIEISNIRELVLAVHTFLRYYLNKDVITKDRDVMHTLLYREDNENFHKRKKEYSIKDFYFNGSGMCSEYAIMGNNILSIFNVDTTVIFDKEHAFNIVVDEMGDGFILDFSQFIIIRDIDGSYITNIPFFEKINDFDIDLYNSIIVGGKRLRFEEYYCIKINDNIFRVPNGVIRDYGADVFVDSKSKLL